MADKISITICGDGGCEDSYSVTRTVDGLPYFLSITDTAGQEEYRGLWTDSTMKSDAFLLVYDITNPSSLQTLDYFMDFIKMEAEQRLEDNERLRKEFGPNPTGIQIGMPPPVKIVAGNKCDLKDGRAVTSRDGLEYARLNGCGFMETSAREMVNIEETFALLVRRVVQSRRQHNMQGTASVRPPSRAGQSVHTTALPTIKANVGARESQSRRSRFFRFRSWKTAETKQGADDGVDKDAKRGASVDQEEKEREKEKEKEKEEAEPRRSWVRQLCCLGCGFRWGCGCCSK
ncbi:hypothetical protein N7533_000541 [Penicillium manginii]|uniref:uncharacterized protein n=1 Tax=Penicillium manginii TaxID=203109 RepID=UPI00254859E8|nr:uncharacterized protein N7533_000541 [Penicillium manginii]KAJ5767958.1 hypothetical protein N7533_000541 [Penicillium manginii]